MSTITPAKAGVLCYYFGMMKIGNQEFYTKGEVCTVCGLPRRMHKDFMTKLVMFFFYPRSCRKRHTLNKTFGAITR